MLSYQTTVLKRRKVCCIYARSGYLGTTTPGQAYAGGNIKHNRATGIIFLRSMYSCFPHISLHSQYCTSARRSEGDECMRRGEAESGLFVVLGYGKRSFGGSRMVPCRGVHLAPGRRHERVLSHFYYTTLLLQYETTIYLCPLPATAVPGIA